MPKVVKKNTKTSDHSNSVKNIINNNNIFVSEINQLLHNEGVIMDDRLDIVINIVNHCLYDKKIELNISKKVADEIIALVKSVSIDRDEVMQILFMFYCDKKVKINLDQFYTPYTIGRFLSKLMIPGKSVIDPASGTGDLVKNYEGDITLWDINEEVLNICTQNYAINNKVCTIGCHNSIVKHELNNDSYDYCCLNPPFGSSTVVKDPSVLNNYKLGKNKKSQEIGILFVERAMNLLKPDGVAFIIVPNGYLGNSTKNMIEFKEYLRQFRIISLLELPANTFARSGTGVSTSIIIIQKSTPASPYNIFIRHVENIGYVLNKKNTPYKYKTTNGNISIIDGRPVLDDDLVDCAEHLAMYADDNQIDTIVSAPNSGCTYETLASTDIYKNILDINRYLNRYLEIVNTSNKKKVGDFVMKKVNGKFDIVRDTEYLYLDIKQITSPIYNKTNYMYGYELPSRAKISVKKHDIIISKLKGKISFTVILSDDTNIVCSNGFALLRPKDYESMVILFANLFSKDFKMQHNSLCTGSIMASLSDDDIKKILINPTIDYSKYDNIIKALEVINEI